jgi:hypothetical protein
MTRRDLGLWQIVWADPGSFRLLGTGLTPEAAICAALGETLEPDPPCEEAPSEETVGAITGRLLSSGLPRHLAATAKPEKEDAPPR